MSEISITIPCRPRFGEEPKYKLTNIKWPEGINILQEKERIIDAVIDWFEEWENQPKAIHVHPL